MSGASAMQMVNKDFTFLRRDLLVGETNQLDKVKTQLEEILKTMQFGSVTLVVQDGKIIQIEKNEKIRLGK